jgi:hypothetical protein
LRAGIRSRKSHRSVLISLRRAWAASHRVPKEVRYICRRSRCSSGRTSNSR